MSALFECIKDDHRKIDDLFTRLRDAPADDLRTRERLFTEVKTLLDWHGHAEEAIFYPLLDRLDQGGQTQNKLTSAHKQVDQLLDEMADLAIDDAAFADRLNQVQQMVAQHVKEEEGSVMPQLQSRVSEQDLQEQGEIWTERREITETAATGGGYTGPETRPPPVSPEHRLEDTRP